LLDRIDIHIEVPRLKQDELMRKTPGESSANMRDRVRRARAVQYERFAGTSVYSNAHMTTRQLRQYVALTPDAESMLKQAIEHLKLSARAYDRILKISRTIADLAEASNVGIEHIAEAVQYRSLDRKYWG
jgi:magnesium chelatase family protein